MTTTSYFYDQPKASKFSKIIVGKGNHKVVDLAMEIIDAHGWDGITRASLLNDNGQIYMGSNPVFIKKSDLFSIADVYSGPKDASPGDPSSRLAMILGYMEYEIPAGYFPGIQAYVRIAPNIYWIRNKVEIDRNVYQWEEIQVQDIILTSLSQKPVEPKGTLSRTWIMADITNPSANLESSISSPGECDKLEVSALVDSAKPLSFVIIFLQTARLFSIGGKMHASVDNWWSPGFGIHVNYLRMSLDGVVFPFPTFSQMQPMREWHP
jgi:hypothetical protein